MRKQTVRMLSQEKFNFELLYPRTFWGGVTTEHASYQSHARKDSVIEKTSRSRMEEGKWNGERCESISFRVVDRSTSIIYESNDFSRYPKVRKSKQGPKVVKNQSPYVRNKSDYDRIMMALKPVRGPNKSVVNQIQRHNQNNRKTYANVILNQKQSFKVKLGKYCSRIGLKNDQKIFIFNSQDTHIREVLQRNGWVENKDKDCAFYHLKWVYSDNPADYNTLTDYQFYNHFKNNQQLTNKNLLRKNIKNYHGRKPNFPLTYDLQYGEDQLQFKQEYKKINCYKLLEQLLQKYQKDNMFSYLKVLKKYEIQRKSGLFHYSIFDGNEELDVHKICSIMLVSAVKDNWNDLTLQIRQLLYSLCQLMRRKKCAKVNNVYGSKTMLLLKVTSPKTLDIVFNKLSSHIENDIEAVISILNHDHFILSELAKLNCHYLRTIKNCYGHNNVWITKPVAVSRGTGITLSHDLNKILSSKYGRLIQKYIQKPLILSNGRKFDIRQWVLVKSFDPLVVYVFQKCYGRLSYQKYQEDNLTKMEIHLTNYNKNKELYIRQSSAQDSIFSEEQLQQQIGQSWQSVKKQIHLQILRTLKACQLEIEKRQSSFEVYGFDLLIDSNLKPWVLQVNLSPACKNRSGFLDEYLTQMAEGVYDLVMRRATLRNWQKLEEKQLQNYESTQQIENAVLKIQRNWRAWKTYEQGGKQIQNSVQQSSQH